MDPDIGIWISRDPKEQHFNSYKYGSNNPIGRIDPDGKVDISITTKHTVNNGGASVYGTTYSWNLNKALADYSDNSAASSFTGMLAGVGAGILDLIDMAAGGAGYNSAADKVFTKTDFSGEISGPYFVDAEASISLGLSAGDGGDRSVSWVGGLATKLLGGLAKFGHNSNENGDRTGLSISAGISKSPGYGGGGIGIETTRPDKP